MRQGLECKKCEFEAKLKLLVLQHQTTLILEQFIAKFVKKVKKKFAFFVPRSGIISITLSPHFIIFLAHFLLSTQT